jgi:branched-chain amino acid transport system substrate-binding protein
MISPSNTNPCLTKEQQPPLPPCTYHAADLRNGNPNNYFRVVTTDDYQGPAMADYAYKTLNIHTIAVLDDSTVFGVGIAGSFESEFKRDGGTVAKHSEYQKATTSDWKSILLTFKNASAQGVYAGGTDDQNLCVPRKQMKDIGWDVPFMGGDGIETTDCIDQASGNEAGVYATTAGADATQIPGASATIAAFRKAFTGPNDFGGYTMQAYDAANAMMNAIGRAITDANGSVPTREQVRAEMAKTKGFIGVIGTYDFDANGDNNLKIVSIYVTKQVSDPAQSSGVCGKNATKTCFVWGAQVDFNKISG